MALLTPDEREMYETSLVENSLFNLDNVGAKATKCYKVGLKMLDIYFSTNRIRPVSPNFAFDCHAKKIPPFSN